MISLQEYFPTPSMNETVRLVREKLDKVNDVLHSLPLSLLLSVLTDFSKPILIPMTLQIQSRSGNTDTASASKRAKVDNRRRI